MKGLDLIERIEIPIQNLLFRNEALQVDVPLHPQIFSLDPLIRLDRTIPKKIHKDKLFIEECEHDIFHYMKSVSNFSSKQKQELELLAYEKFDPNWSFLVKQSGTNEHFLDLVWNDGKYNHEIGYIQTPTIVFNYKKPSGICYVPEEIAEGCNVSIFAMYYGIETVGDSSLMIFSREKFMKFHGADKLFRDDITIVEVAVHTLSSTYLTNMPQAIILRNFVVRYLNDLVSKALN